jgi:hypothetical protein
MGFVPMLLVFRPDFSLTEVAEFSNLTAQVYPPP